MYEEGKIWGIVARRIAQVNNIHFFNYDPSYFGEWTVDRLDTLDNVLRGIPIAEEKLQGVINAEVENLLAKYQQQS